MVKNKKVLIIQNYNLNKGDSSVISVMLDSLKDENIEFSITSFDPILAEAEYNLTAFEWLVSFNKIIFAKSKFEKFVAITKEIAWICYSIIWVVFFKFNRILYLPKKKKQTINAYLESDVIVIPGGHFFTNLNGIHQVFSHFWGLYFAFLLGKKTMIYAHTIGPFFGKYKYICKLFTKLICKKVNIITIREADSMKYCKGLNNVYLTSETVFLNQVDNNIIIKAKDYINFETSKREKVGLTIHHIYYKHFFSKEEYKILMSSIIDFITTTKNYDVILIPMESASLINNDTTLAKEIKSILKNKDNFYILEIDYSPTITSAIIANMKIFIGTKTHSIIYGLKSYVPTIAIAYQQKSIEFMKLFSVECNSIELKNLTLDRFVVIFNRITSDIDKYKELQASAYINVKHRAEINNNLLISLLNE